MQEIINTVFLPLELFACAVAWAVLLVAGVVVMVYREVRHD